MKQARLWINVSPREMLVPAVVELEVEMSWTKLESHYIALKCFGGDQRKEHQDGICHR